MEEKEEVVDLFNDNEQPEDTMQAVEEEVAQTAPTFEVPSKFQGKSFEDVVESYVNLEKQSGRQANERGREGRRRRTLVVPGCPRRATTDSHRPRAG